MVKAISSLVVLLLLGAGTAANANPRQVLTDSVLVSVTTMTPVNPQPGRTLRMSGRLRNASGDDIAALQVRLLLSGTPLATRSEISTVAAGLPDRDGPPTLAVSEPVPLLLSRSSADWALEYPLDDLPLSFPGVYVAGLEVIGTSTDGVTQRLGLTRTFLPWFPEGSVARSSLVWLWPVTSPPDRALEQVQLSEQAAAEMAPGGRLERIITGAGDARVTWVFDPCVLETAEIMASGYSVSAGSATQLTPGAGSTVAQQWLSAVRDVADDQVPLATPYAFPDATALQRAGMQQTVVRATQRAAADVTGQTRVAVQEVLAWPAAGTTTVSTMRTFRDSGATNLLLSDTTLPATPPLTYTPDPFTTWGGMPVTLADSGLSAALAEPQQTRGQALLARQRFLSEVAMSSAELPDVQRSLVAAPDPLWAPRSSFLRQTLRALQRVPYARLSTLQAAARGATEVTRTRVRYSPDQRLAELSGEYLAQVRVQQRKARRFQSILNVPDGIGYEQAVMRQTSAMWRLDPTTGQALQRLVSSQLENQTQKVRVATTGTFTLPGDSGRIPVTVANDLSQDVTVGIRLRSDEPARLVASEIAPFVVPAGRKVSLEAEARVIGSGTLPVRLQLVTPAGRRYGEPVTVQVRTTAYSRAAAYVVTGAFVILAFLLAMNFVRRRRAGHEHGSVTEPDSAGS